MEAKIKDEDLKSEIVEDLRNFGCCDLCILRYLGITEPYIYRKQKDSIKSELGLKDDVIGANSKELDNVEPMVIGTELEDLEQPALKLTRTTPCVTCLGLLDSDHGTSDRVLEQIASDVKKADIEAKSYTINLSLPIAIQFRAYFVWHQLMNKFSRVYGAFPAMKPEGICLKNAWKWICGVRLKEKIDPNSDWTTDGCLTINVSLKYDDDDTECNRLNRELRYLADKRARVDLSRNSVDFLFNDMSTIEFKRKFGDNPPAASKFLVVEDINCFHIPVYVAGRYCKYSRKVSQTPWILKGKKFHDGSVEELIAAQVLPLMKAAQEKFSASGREDVDVRMLGKGRPFVLEVLSPRRTFFTQEDMSKLRDEINNRTTLISVRDLQIVEKKAAGKLKDGEEFKRKSYCALCMIPGGEVTSEMLDKLNNHPVPLVLQQNTPIRVLHRRTLVIRERSVFSIKAIPAKTKNLFKLYVETQAGTYVKELVHGDMGRTKPSIAEILGCDTDIVSLDVENVDFAWPPSLDDAT